MAYDIRLMKLVTGELIIGKYDADKDCLNEVATLQTVPTQQGVQMMLLPYGYPFEPDFTGSIEGKNFLYRYANTPKELHQSDRGRRPRQDAVQLRTLWWFRQRPYQVIQEELLQQTPLRPAALPTLTAQYPRNGVCHHSWGGATRRPFCTLRLFSNPHKDRHAPTAAPIAQTQPLCGH